MEAIKNLVPRDTRTNAPQSGPPPGVLAVVLTALFLGGLVLSTVLAGGDPFPSPFGDSDAITAYFRDHGNAVRVSGALQFAASVPLAIYAATVSARLNRLGVRAPGATIALAGGVLASAFLACSGLVTWVLSHAEVTQRPELVRALQYLAFGLGGPRSADRRRRAAPAGRPLHRAGLADRGRLPAAAQPCPYPRPCSRGELT
ncbi:hypothetical protein ACFCXH_41060 [Streptomyces nojiriensis]|uniref:hypothetical protein n=1 Tax=Streptomyces nojiriensis TaxID=66374 RepID=UPI0035DE989A